MTTPPPSSHPAHLTDETRTSPTAPPDESTVDGTLCIARRDHLIRSWRREDDATYEIVIGRGTVATTAMSSSAVLRLAVELRRDRITVVGPGYPTGYRTVRYNLSDGRFVDRNASRVDRYFDEHPYTVYLPGGDPSGCARPYLAARTLREALALAGLARVRGRCTVCASLRPLRVSGWAPDPAVPCPGCAANSSVPALPLCMTCGEMITPAPRGQGMWRNAWAHTGTNSALCADRFEHHSRRPLAYPA